MLADSNVWNQNFWTQLAEVTGKSIPEIGEMVGPEIFVAAGSGPNALNIILVIVILASLLEIGVTAFRTLMYGAKK
jgi:hypothetical protein